MTTDREEKILLLGAHRWSRQPVVDLARSAGLEPMLLVHDEEQIPSELVKAVRKDHILRLRTSQPLSAGAIAEMLSIEGAKWYAVGLDDYVCELAAELSGFSSRRTMPASAPKETLEKHLLRVRWNRLCENHPSLFPVPFRFIYYSDHNFSTKTGEYQDGMFDEDCPLIVKPDALDASIGIRSASTWSQAEEEIENIRSELSTLAKDVLGLGIKISPGIIVEHRIPRSSHLHSGAEFSAEFLSTRLRPSSAPEHFLIGITQKYINPETFVEVAHCFPSETFPRNLVETIRQVTTTLLNELQVEFCISHWEYIVTDDGRLGLVEAQLRPAGDRITDLIWRATGSNPYQVLFSALRDSHHFHVPSFAAQRFAAVFFPQPVRFVRGSLSLIKETRTEVLDSSVFIGADLTSASAWGSEVRWYSKHIAVLTVGATFTSARIHCDEVLSSLKLRVETSLGEELVSLSVPSL